MLELAQQLRRDGVNAVIDKFQSHQEDWVVWMRDQVEAAQTVLCVCSTNWRTRYEGKADDGNDFGVRIEGDLLRDRIAQAKRERRPHGIIPVGIGERPPNNVVPALLRNTTSYGLAPGSSDYQALLDWLRGDASVTPEPLAEAPVLSRGARAPMVQVLVLLDALQPGDLEGVEAHITRPGLARHVLRLTEHGYQRPSEDAPRDALDWSMLSTAIDQLAKSLHAHRLEATAPIEVYVSGHAPLGAFYALGTRLDTRTMWVTHLQANKHSPERWDVLDLTPRPGGELPLVASGIEGRARRGAGQLAVYISPLQQDVPAEQIEEALGDDGPPLLEIVSLVAPGHERLDIDRQGMPSISHQLGELFEQIERVYPRRLGMSLFLHCPAFVALAAGWLTIPHHHLEGERTIDLFAYVAGTYHRVLRLPLRP